VDGPGHRRVGGDRGRLLEKLAQARRGAPFSESDGTALAQYACNTRFSQEQRQRVVDALIRSDNAAWEVDLTLLREFTRHGGELSEIVRLVSRVSEPIGFLA